ncbi:MAG: penicillin-binding protein 2 [Thermoleophilia bacterium]|nr:penicillin-binding protein 2 [Thermoleophilia bacterium]
MPPRRPRRRRAVRAAPLGVGRMRVRVLAVIVMIAFGLLGARAAFLGTVRAGELGDQALQQQRTAFDIEAPRGSIRSSDGAVLARDELAVDVSASPFLITGSGEAAEQLSPILKIRRGELEDKLEGNGRYASLAREVSPKVAREVERLDLTGIHLRDTYRRVLPRGTLGAQTLGLTDNDGNGLSGLEQQFDQDLKGTPGARVEATDPLGRPLKVIDNSEPRAGASIRLTLRADIQDQAERVLAATRRRHGAKSAMALVMRPRDGAVLAMATVPGFNPNNRKSVDEALTRNRVVTDTFEPGSTFKAITFAAALQEGVTTPKSRYDLPPTLEVYDRVLREAHPRPAANWTATEILERSSNVGTVKIAQQLEPPRIQSWIERFGFGEPTGIDFPGEARGLVLPLTDWSGTTIINVPIGQGIGITALQLARAYAAIANGGYLVEPHLVRSVGGTPVRRTPKKRIMSAKTARQLDRMLRRVVSPSGTGQAAEVAGFNVAGKTGTAEKVDPETGLYSTSNYTASFVGYAPAGRPQLLIAVIVDEPSTGIIFGGEVAGPVFEQIANFSLQKLGISP